MCACIATDCLKPGMEFTVGAMIHGYHKDSQIWEAEDGKALQCQRETGNRYDLYAASTMKNDVVVGHVPRLISSLYSIFIQRGGSITCIVTRIRRYSAYLVQGDGNSLQDDLHYA